MVYVVKKEPPKFHQMTWEELIDPNYTEAPKPILNISNTHTYVKQFPSERDMDGIDINDLVNSLVRFNELTAELREVPRKTLYREFSIPKRSGGYRRISAPQNELKAALYALKDIFTNKFKVLYHTSAYAYIKNRNTIDALKRHQENESKWFAKFDLKDFFGSTTLDFVVDMFSMIFPFDVVCAVPEWRNELRTALSLCFLDGGLPQGTPISPMITNVMMIPIDFHINRELKNHNKQRFVYTRYADDFLISSKYTFNHKEMESFVVEILKRFNAPFTIKSEKTRYGSSAGANWNLGLMLNKDNQITIGNKKKKEFSIALHNYAMDKLNGIAWSLEDVQTLEGLRSYYTMVEKDAINNLIAKMSRKLGLNIMATIKNDLATL